jgi:excisionase family DNA binding protein
MARRRGAGAGGPPGRFLGVQEVAGRLGVHPETVRRWLRDGRLAGANVGGSGGYRIAEAEVDRVAALMAAGHLPEKGSAPGAGPSKTLAAAA